MTDLIDISLGLHADMPTWPGSAGFRIFQAKSIRSDSVNVSQLECDTHIGTHVDAPLHFMEHGASVDQLMLSKMVGPACVLDFRGVEAITYKGLAQSQIPLGTKRLLMLTDNSKLWHSEISDFQCQYVAITPDGASWMVENQIDLVGIDYLSVQRYEDPDITHKRLLEAEVIVLEGLDLSKIQPGNYELICLPLKLIGAEGAPARAVLRHISGN